MEHLTPPAASVDTSYMSTNTVNHTLLVSRFTCQNITFNFGVNGNLMHYRGMGKITDGRREIFTS